MNIEAHCCGLVILICLLYFYFRQKKIGLKTERIFAVFLCVSTSCIVLGIVSVIMMTNHIEPHILIHVVGKIYQVNFVYVILIAAIYSLSDFYSDSVLKIYYRICFALMVADVIMILALPIKFYAKGYVVYFLGPSTLATYVICFLAMAYMIFCLIHFRKQISIFKRSAVAVWLSVWLVAAGIQFFNNQLLIVEFALAIGAMIIYLSLENPESNIDKMFGCFNTNALMLLLKNGYTNGEKFCMLTISIPVTQQDNAMFTQSNFYLLEIANRLSSYKKIRIFKALYPGFVIVAKQKNILQKIIDESLDEFSQLAENYNLHKPIFIVVPDSALVQNEQDARRLVEQVRVHHISDLIDEVKVITITEEIVKGLRTEDVVSQKIADALHDDRIEIFLQPIYSVKEKRFVSAEALARLRDTDGSIIAPGVFIPVAEKTGSIKALGLRVFEKTCKFISEHKHLFDAGFKYIEINLSVLQCEQHDLAESFINVIKQYDIPPSTINLEITETASIHTKNILLKNMRQLIEFGVKFSLDDFGAGRSNLNYLDDMPVAIVKFDYDVTQAYCLRERTQKIAYHVVQMIREFDLQIVAEGVETKEQLDAMEKLGVDFIQGYYFSKPLPCEQFVEFIAGKSAL